MNLETREVTRLTDGVYDNFNPVELPDGALVFLSTRRGGYARCNQSWEPITAATLHRRHPDGKIETLSWHETNEWNPYVLSNGQIVYSRWDYVDRSASRYHGLWLTNPDGTGASILFGNYTEDICACMQPVEIPHSNKIMFLAAAHHLGIGGSLVILDPSKVKYDPATGFDTFDCLERITPEVPFPETNLPGEAAEYYIPQQYYYGPYPLSEDFYLVSYSHEMQGGYLPTHGTLSKETVISGKLGLYYRDRFDNLELMYEDDEASCRYPLLLQEREVPPVLSSRVSEENGDVGTFTLFDVYESLWPFPANRKIKELRVFQILPKTPGHAGHVPQVGHDFAGNARMYLGSVPVEEDGSASFTAPAKKPLYFQAIDEEGKAVQTMLSEVYLQPGENRGCVGCHEQAQTTFPNTEGNQVAAALRKPSELKPGPEGTRPFSYPLLIQPILDRSCVSCHDGSEGKAKPALTGGEQNPFSVSYVSLKPYLRWYEWLTATIRRTVSLPGECGTDSSPLTAILEDAHHKDKMNLSDEDRRVLYFWIDANVPFYGSYDPNEQQKQLRGEKIAKPALQ